MSITEHRSELSETPAETQSPVPDFAALAPSFGLESLDPMELTALSGLYKHTEPVDGVEGEVRFSILSARYRAEKHIGRHDEVQRALALNGLYRATTKAVT